MSTTEGTQSIDLVQIGEPTTIESWLVSDWAAGQTTIMEWSPDNVVEQADGSVTFTLSAAPDGSAYAYCGGEVQSCEAASVGTWTWTAQAPQMVDGAVFGMFTYRADHFNDPWIEFDFEFVGSDTTQVRLNIHMETATGEHVTLEDANGGPVIVDLGFDASQGLHTYEITVTETEAIFLIDGQVVGRFSAADMPYGTWTTGDMKGFTNLWCVDPSLESWAGTYGGEPLTATVTDIDVLPGDLGDFGPVVIDSTINGDVGDNILIGTDGDDTLNGHTGNDDLAGGAGNDVLRGGDGDDWLDLDIGDDTLDGGAGSDWVEVTGTTAATIDLAKATVAEATGYGSDTILNVENAAGGSGADKLTGADGANVLKGNAGDDILYGRGGADTLVAGAGKDTLHGGVDGARDVFVFTSTSDSLVGAKRDSIHDLVSGIDDIDLSGIGANTALIGEQTFGFSRTTAVANSVWYTASKSEIILKADVNGDKTADLEIRIVGLTSFTAEDLLL